MLWPNRIHRCNQCCCLLHRFAGIKAPRTPNWNKKAPDHHWFVSAAGVYGPMNDTVTDFSDLLYRRYVWGWESVAPQFVTHGFLTEGMLRRRLETLQSTDQYMEDLEATLMRLGVMDDTYIFYTSGTPCCSLPALDVEITHSMMACNPSSMQTMVIILDRYSNASSGCRPLAPLRPHLHSHCVRPPLLAVWLGLGQTAAI